MKMRSFQVCQCGAPLQVNERRTPKPQGTQVLLKMLAAGVCHSDLHIWDGYYEIGGGKKLMLADRGIKLPLTMGHENVGEVVAVGPGRQGREGRRRAPGQSLDGLRRLQGVPARRREPLPQAAECRRVRAGRLCDAHAGAASRAICSTSATSSPSSAAPLACSGVTAFSALKKVADAEGRGGGDHRRGRRRPDGRDAREEDGREGDRHRRHRSGQARRRAQGRRHARRSTAARPTRWSRSRRRPAAAPGRWSTSSARARPSISR